MSHLGQSFNYQKLSYPLRNRQIKIEYNDNLESLSNKLQEIIEFTTVKEDDVDSDNKNKEEE